MTFSQLAPVLCPALLALLAGGLFLLNRTGLRPPLRRLLSGVGALLAAAGVTVCAARSGFPGGISAAMLYLAGVVFIQAWFLGADGAGPA